MIQLNAFLGLSITLISLGFSAKVFADSEHKLNLKMDRTLRNVPVDTSYAGARIKDSLAEALGYRLSKCETEYEKEVNSRVFDLCVEAASAGSTSAMMLVFAMAAEGGQDVPKNYQVALEWLKKAAALGSFAANLQLVQVYENGLFGVSKDLAEANRVYETTIQNIWFHTLIGEAEAQYQLAMEIMMINPRPIVFWMARQIMPVVEAQAIDEVPAGLLKFAAAQGHIKAARALAQIQ